MNELEPVTYNKEIYGVSLFGGPWIPWNTWHFGHWKAGGEFRSLKSLYDALIEQDDEAKLRRAAAAIYEAIAAHKHHERMVVEALLA